MDDEECGICYERDCDVQVYPCGHRYCCNCLNEMCLKFNYKCAFCKQEFYSASFDTHINVNTKVLNVGNGRFAGITLTNSKNGYVKVKDMHKNDEASKCLKRGDIITKINGLPARNHEQVVRIINTCTQRNESVYLCS
jgi:hypothetical protein